MVLVWFNPWEGANLFKEYIIYTTFKLLLNYKLALNVIYFFLAELKLLKIN